jgi:hypothetical protein
VKYTYSINVPAAAIEWVLRETNCSPGHARMLAARLIQRHHPELLGDPVDAIVREELARVYVDRGDGHVHPLEHSLTKDLAKAVNDAAKRLYQLGIEKGKQS